MNHLANKLIKNLDVLAAYLGAIALADIQEALGWIGLVLSVTYSAYKWYVVFRDDKRKSKSKPVKGDSEVPMVIIAAFCLSSCCPTQSIVENTRTTRIESDSTAVSTEASYRPFVIPADTLNVYGILLETYKDSLDQCRIKPMSGSGVAGRLQVKYKVIDNRLSFEAMTQAYRDSIQDLKTTISHFQTVYEEVIRDKTVVKVERFSIWRQWWFWLAVAVIIIHLLWKFREYIPFLNMIR